MKDTMSFRPNKAQKKAIKEQMTKNNLEQSDAIRKLIDKGLNMENRFGFLDDTPCKLRDYLGENEAPPKKDGGWYCMKKAPDLKLLGSGIEIAANKICGKCIIRDGALADSKLMKEQRTKGITQTIPQCTKGGRLSEDMLKLWCPETGDWRPIMEKTKKKEHKPCRLKGDYNSNCKFLKLTKVVIKGDLPYGQNL